MNDRDGEARIRPILTYVVMVAVFALLFFLASCGPKSPLEELADAQAALNSARENGAETVGTEEYRKAEALLDQALQKMREKKYDEARSLAIEAKSWLDRIPASSAPPEPTPGMEKDPVPAPDYESLLLTHENLTRPDAGLALPRAYFDFNDFAVRDDATEILKRNGQWLIDHPSVQLDIQGHCDERGTHEYNLALGERRAVAVREYLEALGVDRERLRVISYGEELPLKDGEGEEYWKWNRRVQFVLRSTEYHPGSPGEAGHPGPVTP